jgi:hypothetical protein
VTTHCPGPIVRECSCRSKALNSAGRSEMALHKTHSNQGKRWTTVASSTRIVRFWERTQRQENSESKYSRRSKLSSQPKIPCGSYALLSLGSPRSM